MGCGDSEACDATPTATAGYEKDGLARVGGPGGRRRLRACPTKMCICPSSPHSSAASSPPSPNSPTRTPSSPERVEFERAALGDAFVAGEPVWSQHVHDPEQPRANVWRIVR